MQKLTELEKQRLLRKGHKLIDRLEEILNFMADELQKNRKKAA